MHFDRLDESYVMVKFNLHFDKVTLPVCAYRSDQSAQSANFDRQHQHNNFLHIHTAAGRDTVSLYCCPSSPVQVTANVVRFSKLKYNLLLFQVLPDPQSCILVTKLQFSRWFSCPVLRNLAKANACRVMLHISSVEQENTSL